MLAQTTAVDLSTQYKFGTQKVPSNSSWCSDVLPSFVNTHKVIKTEQLTHNLIYSAIIEARYWPSNSESTNEA
jgi:hypothetical protein